MAYVEDTREANIVGLLSFFEIFVGIVVVLSAVIALLGVVVDWSFASTALGSLYMGVLGVVAIVAGWWGTRACKGDAQKAAWFVYAALICVFLGIVIFAQSLSSVLSIVIAVIYLAVNVLAVVFGMRLHKMLRS